MNRVARRLMVVLVVAALSASLVPVGERIAFAAERRCPTALLGELGLRSGRTPKVSGLEDSVFVVSRPHRPRAGRYCLVDLWTVPETGWYAQRYVLLVDVRTRSIVSYTDVMTVGGAAPHDWKPRDFRGIEFDSAAHSEIVVMLCYESGPLLAPVKGLVRRLTGQAMPNCG